MIGNQSGVSTVKMFGVDYANQWWDKLKVQGSYSFNTTKNTTEALTQREYFSDQLYDETGRDNPATSTTGSTDWSNTKSTTTTS